MIGEVQVLPISACREEARGPKSVQGNVFRTLIEMNCKEVILQQVRQEHRDGDVGEEVVGVDVNPHDGDGVARPRRDASTSCDFDVQSWVVAMLPVPGGHQEREEMLMAAARRAVSFLYVPIESRAIHLARLQTHHLWGRSCWDSSATERGYELVLSWAAASFGGVAVGTAIRRRGALWGSSGTDSATRAPKVSDLLSPSSCGEKAIEGGGKTAA